MARIYIDPHMFGEKWFSELIQPILSSRRSEVIYSRAVTFQTELSRTRKAVEFYRLASSLNLVRIIDRNVVDSEIQRICELDAWRIAECCDDPFVFAASSMAPIDYVISKDQRIAHCRRLMNRILGKGHRSFAVVSTEKTFNAHKSKIIG